MKAIIYARYSPRPKDQAETTETIESQVKRCRAFAAYLEHEERGVYSDADKSGKTMQRDGLQKALRHVKRFRGEGVLVVYSLSRLSRSVVDRIEIANDLTRRGARIASVTESFDTSTANGRMIYAIMAAIDQGVLEIGNQATSDKMKDYQDDGNGKGRRMGRIDRVRYGWEPDPDSEPHPQSGLPTGVRRNEEEQGVIAWMLAKDAKGLAGTAIAKRLNETGFTCRGRKWGANAIRKIVKRERAK